MIDSPGGKLWQSGTIKCKPSSCVPNKLKSRAAWSYPDKSMGSITSTKGGGGALGVIMICVKSPYVVLRIPRWRRYVPNVETWISRFVERCDTGSACKNP